MKDLLYLRRIYYTRRAVLARQRKQLEQELTLAWHLDQGAPLLQVHLWKVTNHVYLPVPTLFPVTPVPSLLPPNVAPKNPYIHTCAQTAC